MAFINHLVGSGHSVHVSTAFSEFAQTRYFLYVITIIYGHCDHYDQAKDTAGYSVHGVDAVSTVRHAVEPGSCHTRLPLNSSEMAPHDARCASVHLMSYQVK